MRSSLGRIIRLRGIGGRGTSLITGRVPTATNGSNMNRNRNRNRNSSSYASIPPYLDSFPTYRFGENADKYREEYRLKKLTSKSNYGDANNDPDSKFVQKGDTIDLNDLLFTKERDYLIKNNNQQVKAEQLEGKVIALYFVPLPHNTSDYNTIKWDATFVMDEYKDLQPENNFEVVLVPTTRKSLYKFPSQFDQSFQIDCQQHFDILFSYMPWTAIPFWDVASRERLQRTFGLSRRYIYSRHMLAIVDPMGKVLQYDAWNLLFNYGALGYPFSDERIECLMEEDDAIIKQPSLRKLLASPQRDYVISNKGDQVPIHTFEDKVVALYFCTCTKSPGNLELFEELKLAYEELAQVKGTFEVVFIYSREFAKLSDWPSEELFCEEFKTMPWLALPFRDPNCKKLNRIFEISCLENFASGGLVIFGPHGEFIEPFASHILHLYKIPGYPFTRRRVAQLETEKVKELKLEMICDPNTVVRMKDRSQVPFCQLAGKRIMLVLEFDKIIGGESLNANFLMMLKRLYRKAKGTADEFEVIRVLMNEESSTSKHFIRSMPWLVSHASQWIHANLGSYIWHDKPLDELSYFPVFAFDQDGKLVRKTKYPTIEDTNFPFSGGGLEEDALSQLNTHFEWNYWDYKGGSIYSHSDNQKAVDLTNFPFGCQY